jgi:hypothetical protein
MASTGAATMADGAATTVAVGTEAMTGSGAKVAGMVVVDSGGTMAFTVVENSIVVADSKAADSVGETRFIVVAGSTVEAMVEASTAVADPTEAATGNF